jgi:RHS repeat-associated protein
MARATSMPYVVAPFPKSFRLADVNNDAIPDLIRYNYTAFACRTDWYVSPGSPSGTFGSETKWGSADGDRRWDAGTVLADVNGDGYPDLVYGAGPRIEVLLNKGSEYLTAQVWYTSPSDQAQNLTIGNYVFVEDMNGDGKSDLIRLVLKEYRTVTGTIVKLGGFPFFDWTVYYSNGNEFKQTGVVWLPSSQSFNQYTMTLTPPLSPGNLKQDFIKRYKPGYMAALIDMNNDGLPDLIYNRYAKTVWANKIDHSPAYSWHMRYNTGSGFDSEVHTLRESPLYSVYPTYHGAYDFSEVCIGHNGTLVDINGDGLKDLVYTDINLDINTLTTGSGSSTPSHFKATICIALNTGGTFTTTESLFSLDYTIETYRYWQVTSENLHFADINYDGLADLIYPVFSDKARTEDAILTWNALINTGSLAPGHLTSHTDRYGGTTSVAYKSSSSCSNTLLPFIFPVVSSVTRDNGTGVTGTTSYSYSGGLYDIARREFKGFATVTTTDPLGHTTTTTYHQDDSRLGKPSQETNSLKSVSYTYQSDTTVPYDTPLAETRETLNGKNRRTTYTCDIYGNVTKTTDYGDTAVTDDEKTKVTEYTYNTDKWLLNLPRRTRLFAGTDTTAPPLTETRYIYDRADDYTAAPTKGDLTKTLYWLNTDDSWFETSAVYDAWGNTTAQTDALGNTTETAYDTTYNFLPLTLTNALGYTTTNSWYLSAVSGGLFGQLKSTTDANGNTTTFAYDTLGRKIKETGPYDTSSTYGTTSWEYTMNGPGKNTVLTRKTETSGSAEHLIGSEIMDGFGNVIQTVSESEDTSSVIRTTTIYNKRGEVEKVSLPVITAGTAFTTYAAPATDTKWTTTSYDALGRILSITKPDSSKVTTAYSGWTRTVTDENSHVKIFIDDAYGRLISVQEKNGTDTYTTRYTWNAAGNLTGITDHAGNTTAFTWDSLGRRTGFDDPDLGTWSFEYDKNGNMTKRIDAKNQSIIYTYDKLNRLTAKNDGSAASNSVTITYDQTSGINGIGRRTAMTDESGTTGWEYDKMGRINKETRTIDGTDYTLAWSYDDLGRLSNISGSSGTGSTAYLSAVEYSADGQITRLTYGNGVETSYTYDNLSSRLTRITTRSGTTLLLDKSYKFDKAGNITTISDEISGNIQSFVYDDLSRLTSSAGTRGTTTYSYDSLGNLTSKDGVTYDYSPAYPHRVTGLSDGTSFEYDKAGNLVTLSKNGINKSITYDQNNRITRIQSGSGSAHLGHFRLQLLPGDNFISLPVVPEKSDINAVFTSIRNKRGQIAHWNPSGDDYLYNVNDPSYDQITDLEYGKGYWVEINSIYDDEILVDGSAPTSSSLSLNKGWNAIGMPAPVPMPIETALAPLALGTDYSRILQYEAGSNGTFREYSASKQEFTQMIPGRGYWIDMLRDTTWKITNSTAASNVVTEFAYDAEGRRVKKTENGQTILWPDQTYQAGPDGQITIHLFMGTAPLCSVTTDKQNNSTVSYYHNDHLGSSTVVTDASGAVIEQSIYEPFGSVTTTGVLQDTPETAWHYTGKELDDSTGLYYFGARYYDPGLGRFIQPDPVIQSIFDSQTLNPYAYCRNNPLILIDPSGMSFDSFDGGSGSFGSSFGNDFGGSLWDESWDYTSTTGSYSYTQSYTSAGVTTVFGWEGAWSSINSMTTGSMDSFGNLSNPLAPLFTGAAQMAGPSLAVAGMFNEPLDWATTLYQFAQGKATWKDLAWMATPFVSAGIMRAADGVKDMARMARETQLSSGYAADVWKNVTLPKGTIIYQGAPGASGFFTTERSLRKAGWSADALWDGLQVRPSRIFQPRKVAVAYELLEDTPVAFGRATANKYGSGGYGQIFIDPNKAKMKEVYSIQLK